MPQADRRPFEVARFEALAPIWRGRVHYFPAIGSTNQEARRVLRLNPAQPQEALFITDQQTAGRGRLGRSWQAPPNSGVLCTVVFSLAPLTLDRAFLYTASLALSVIAATPGAGVQLKWPNDLVRQTKKTGGILTEVENRLGQAGSESWLTVGFGLNVNLSETDFAQAGLSDKATNLTTTPLEREPLLADILHYFNQYRTRLAHQPASVRAEWAAALVTLGQEVQVLDLNGAVQHQGVATGVAEDGALLLDDLNGQRQRIQAGDVSIRLPDGRYSA